MIVTPKEVMLENPPMRFDQESFDRLLTHAARVGASDVTLQTDKPVTLELHGLLHPIMARTMDTHELGSIMNAIYGQNAFALIKQGKDLDPSYEVKVSRKERYRFRVNATACYAGFEDGIQITIRIISSNPPKIADLGIEEDLATAFRQDNGLVVITGSTGSGKSTLLAAVMRGFLEDPSISKKIITYESPIEYVYDELDSKHSLISQHEIPRHIPNFPHAVRNSLRRAPKIILVGESRDPETINAALEASETGHTLYTTIHSNSVAETVYRMVNMFPANERSAKTFEIIEALRVIVTQRLVRTVDGRRTALREYLIFDQSFRDQLRQFETLRELVECISARVESHGQSMEAAAKKAYEQGLIDLATCRRFEKREVKV